MFVTISKQDAEVERLKAENTDLKKAIETMTNEHIKWGFEAKKRIENAKSEAYKEFADRLKNKVTLKTRVEMHPSPYLGVKPVLQKPEYVIECESFDNILKELTEGSKNELQV